MYTCFGQKNILKRKTSQQHRLLMQYTHAVFTKFNTEELGISFLSQLVCVYTCVYSFECVMSKCILRWKKKSNVQNFSLTIIMHAIQYGVLFSGKLRPLADRVYELVQVTAE